MALKVLVTGGCGFFGANFILYALQNTKWDLVSIDKLTSGSLNNIGRMIDIKRHKLYLGDVCDYQFVRNVFDIERPDIVIHMSNERGKDFIKTNVDGTNNVLDIASQNKIQRFINISTNKVYGFSKEPNSENSPLKPLTPYATSKAAADLLGQSYFNTKGLPVITARFCDNFGPRQDAAGLVGKTIINVLNDTATTFDEQENKEWIYIKDSFGAIQCLVEKGQPGKIYNVGSGVEKTNLEVFNAVMEAMDRSVIKSDAANNKNCIMTSDEIKALGWQLQYEFKAAILHTVGWMKSNGWFWKK